MFAAPAYIKYQKPDATVVPGYIFKASDKITADYGMTVCCQPGKSEADMLPDALAENKTWWMTCIADFLEVGNKYFSKKYSADQLVKYIRHGGLSTDKFTTATIVVYMPKEVTIIEGKFTMMWCTEKHDGGIDIPDFDSEKDGPAAAPAAAPTSSDSSGLDELDSEALPMTGTWDDSHAAGGAGAAAATSSHSRHYEKRKVQEARLKAKLAMYRAEKAITRYLEKYGDDISDSDESEWVSEGEDASDESEGVGK